MRVTYTESFELYAKFITTARRSECTGTDDAKFRPKQVTKSGDIYASCEGGVKPIVSTYTPECSKCVLPSYQICSKDPTEILDIGVDRYCVTSQLLG